MTLVLDVVSHCTELMISSFFSWARQGTGSVVPSVTRPGEEEVCSQDTTETRNGFMCESWLFLKYLRPVETSWCQQRVGWNWSVKSPEVNQSAKEAVTELSFLRAPVNFWLIGPSFINRKLGASAPTPLKWGKMDPITVIMASQDVCKSTFVFDLPDSPVKGLGQAVLVTLYRQDDRGPGSMSLRAQRVSGSIDACKHCLCPDA